MPQFAQLKDVIFTQLPRKTPQANPTDETHIYNKIKRTTNPFDSAGEGGDWQFMSSQNLLRATMDAGLFIYLPRDPGHNIYFKVFDGQDIYFKNLPPPQSTVRPLTKKGPVSTIPK